MLFTVAMKAVAFAICVFALPCLSQPDSMFEPKLQGAIEVESGVSGFTHGLGESFHLGPTWQVRGGVMVLPWLGFDANYSGASNAGRSERLGPGVSLLSTDVFSSVRFVAPLSVVSPYVFAGPGWSWNTVSTRGESAVRLEDDDGPQVVMGGGIDFELTPLLAVGLEGTYQHCLLQGTVTPDQPELGEGDSFNVVLALGFNFE